MQHANQRVAVEMMVFKPSKGPVCLLLSSWSNSYLTGLVVCAHGTRDYTCGLSSVGRREVCLCLTVDNRLTSGSVYTALLTVWMLKQKVASAHEAVKKCIDPKNFDFLCLSAWNPASSVGKYVKMQPLQVELSSPRPVMFSRVNH